MQVITHNSGPAVWCGVTRAPSWSGAHLWWAGSVQFAQWTVWCTSSSVCLPCSPSPEGAGPHPSFACVTAALSARVTSGGASCAFWADSSCGSPGLSWPDETPVSCAPVQHLSLLQCYVCLVWWVDWSLPLNAWFQTAGTVSCLATVLSLHLHQGMTCHRRCSVKACIEREMQEGEQW